jgi:hypothetical protein
LYVDSRGGRKHGKEAWTNYSQLVEKRKFDDQVHDLGFVLCPTWKKWWELTGDEPRRQVVIQDGKTMATRFNAKGKFLRSFLAPDSNFIDISWRAIAWSAQSGFVEAKHRPPSLPSCREAPAPQ